MIDERDMPDGLILGEYCLWCPPDHVPFYRRVIHVRDAPTGWLGHMVNHATMSGMAVRAAQEMIRRHNAGADGVPSLMLARCLKLCPPPCHCGKKGIYIVGLSTYCSDHAREAQRRVQQSGAVLDRQTIEKNRAIEERDQLRRRMDAHHQGRDPKVAARHRRK